MFKSAESHITILGFCVIAFIRVQHLFCIMTAVYLNNCVGTMI